MRARTAVVALAVWLLTASGCAGPDQTTAEPPTPTPGQTGTGAPGAPSASGAITSPDTVPPALRFTARTVDGVAFDGASLAGKPVVFWFWAAWCPRCQAAAGGVAALAAEYRDRASVVGVAGLGSGAAAMRKFVADRRIGGFVNLADDEGAVWRRFGVTSQEYYVLVDARGEVVHKGGLSPGELRDRLARLAGRA